MYLFCNPNTQFVFECKRAMHLTMTMKNEIGTWFLYTHIAHAHEHRMHRIALLQHHAMLEN